MDIYYKNIIGRIISIVFTITFLIGSTFLWKRLNSNYNNAFKVLNHYSETIVLTNVLVTSDIDNYSGYGYTFNVASNFRVNKDYRIKIVNDKIDNNDIHYIVDNNQSNTLSDDGVIINGNIEPLGKHMYQVKIWLSNDYDANHLEVVIEFI